MIPFATEGGATTAIFTQDEGEALGSLAAQIAELLSSTDDDPAMARLLPDAYPADREAQAEFSRLTRSDLASRKSANARVIADAFAPGHWPREVVLDPADAVRWLRALTDIRLVLADRLGVGDDGEPARGHDAGMVSIYHWVGAVQDSLVQAMPAGPR